MEDLQLELKYHDRKQPKTIELGDDIVTSLSLDPEAPLAKSTNHGLANLGEDGKGSHSPSDSSGGMGTELTVSREILKDFSKDSTDLRERSPSFRQPFPPPRKTGNPRFNPHDFHALLWVAVSSVKTTQSETSNEKVEPLRNDYHETIESYMQRLHGYMQANDNAKARSDYQNTVGKSFEDMNRILGGLKRTEFDSKQTLSLQVQFASLSESVFQIFLPVGWRTAVASRYWGAVITALTVGF